MSERFVRICGVALVALVLATGGCATVPMAAKEDSAHWKATSPAPGTALVYLYRNETIGYAIHMDVELDGKFWGQTVSKSYMIWQLRPGRHRLMSKAEIDSELVLNVLPGGRYYVWQEVKMGIMSARSKLQEVSSETGQSGLDECQLIEMPLPPPPPAKQPPPPAPAVAPPAPLAGTAPPTS